LLKAPCPCFYLFSQVLLLPVSFLLSSSYFQDFVGLLFLIHFFHAIYFSKLVSSGYFVFIPLPGITRVSWLMEVFTRWVLSALLCVSITQWFLWTCHIYKNYVLLYLSPLVK
jgi:hypothetical protein